MVIGVPMGAVCHVEGDGVTVPTETPDPLRTESIRLWTSLWVWPGTTATRHPSRAAVVSNWATIPNRDASICPRIRVTMMGATIAISTALAPLRRSALQRKRMVLTLGLSSTRFTPALDECDRPD